MGDKIDGMTKFRTAWSRMIRWFQFSATWNLIIQPILVGALVVTVITLAVVYGPRAWAWAHEHARLMAVLETVGGVIGKVLLGALALVALWVIGVLITLVREAIKGEWPWTGGR